jgi:D-alanine-D-alanine ligase-like ATP-grasp enzyme
MSPKSGIIVKLYALLSMSTTDTNAKRCLYCGNNQTSHLTAWIDSTCGIMFGPFFYKLFTLPGGRPLLNFAEGILDHSWDALQWSGMVAYKEGREHVKSSRGEVLYDEAVRRGWKMETALVMGKSVDTYRVTFPNGKVLGFTGLPRLDIVDTAMAKRIDDKALLKQTLEEQGVPVSRGRCVSTWRDAERAFNELPKPIIVKPRLGSRGRHTVTHIYTLEDFKRAFSITRKLGLFVIVEEHLTGSVYRATMIDGKLAGVLAGDPPRVTGDGIRTIQELIQVKNANRHERVGEYKITELTHIFLARQGLSLESVLEIGRTIDLTEKIGLSYGGNAREVTPSVHPKLRAELERAARVVNDPIIGFDFITPDVSQDPGSVHWGIIECNALPFINLHHDPLEGEPVNAAGIFWDYIEEGLAAK